MKESRVSRGTGLDRVLASREGGSCWWPTQVLLRGLVAPGHMAWPGRRPCDPSKNRGEESWRERQVQMGL